MTSDQLQKLVAEFAQQIVLRLPRHFNVILTITEQHPAKVSAASTSSLDPFDTARVLQSYMAQLSKVIEHGAPR